MLGLSVPNQKPMLGEVLWHRDPGQVGLWVMNEGGGPTVRDYSGNGNDGTLAGDVTWSGPKLVFDGSDGRVNLPAKLMDAAESTDQFTIAAWVRLDSLAADGAIFGQFGGVDQSQVLLYYDVGGTNGYRAIAISTGGTIATSVNNGGAVAEKWQYVVMTYTAATITLYLDASLVESVSGSGTLEPSTDAPAIGSDRAAAAAREWLGQIDSVVFSNRAWTQLEVAKNYLDTYWQFRHDPIELWAATSGGGAPPATVVPQAYMLMRA